MDYSPTPDHTTDLPMEQKVSQMEVVPTVIGNHDDDADLPPSFEQVLELRSSQNMFQVVENNKSNDGSCLPEMCEDNLKRDEDEHFGEPEDFEEEPVTNVRARPDCFKRPGAFKGQCETSDEEEARLLGQGLDGISQPLFVGTNVDGSNMYLPPMGPGEKLLKIPMTNHKSDDTLVMGVAKLIAQNQLTGCRDVAHVECWKHSDGTDYPSLECGLDHSKTFVDNMTVWAPVKSIFYTLFKLFDLEARDGMSDRPRFSVTRCGNETQVIDTVTLEMDNAGTQFRIREKKNFKFRVMLAGVPLETIAVVHEVLEFARTLPLEVLRDDEKLGSVSQDFRDQHWGNYHPKNLLLAVRSAAQVKWHDTDLTTDYRGTLHVSNMIREVEKRGEEISEHMCGRNMVRVANNDSTHKGRKEGTNIVVTTSEKCYNKVQETLTSVYAKSNVIGCKWSKLLNSSTCGLQETFEAFCEEGVTRYETTHSCKSGVVPKLDDLVKLHKSKNRFSQGTLVKNSVENHVRQLEEAAECSVGILFPHIDVKKKNGMREMKKDKLLKTRDANKQADGCVIHCYDSKTQRFIGSQVHSKLKRYGNTTKNGMQVMMENLCYGVLVKNPSVFAVCVAGPGMCIKGGKICTEPGFDVKRGMWFRLFRAVVMCGNAPAPSDTRLMYLAGPDGSFSGRKAIRSDVTDMGRIGIDVSRLTNARIAVLDKKFEPSFANMGSLKVDLQPISSLGSAAYVQPESLLGEKKSSDCFESTSLPSSEVRRRVAGVKEKLCSIQMLPTTPLKVSRHREITSTGRAEKGLKKSGRTIELSAGGDKYKVPDVSSEGLYEAMNDNKLQGVERDLYIWQDCGPDGKANGVFRWEFRGSEMDLACQDNHQIRKSMLIPFGEVHTVLNMERKPHSRGNTQLFARLGDRKNKYFLPNTIKHEIEDYLRCNCLDLNHLKGWSLERVSEETVKTVPASKNREPALLLRDPTGNSRVEIKNFDPRDVPPYAGLSTLPNQPELLALAPANLKRGSEDPSSASAAAHKRRRHS